MTKTATKRKEVREDKKAEDSTYTCPPCKVLSTHTHRFCDKGNCTCECNNLVNPKNYEKHGYRKVKRVG